ncbi:hypothetical protein ACXPWS_11535 [Mycobacterium sp. BMJ-28]
MTAIFDPNTYDPFKHYEPNRESHQRINQTLSQAGAPAVLDWPEIDAMAETMADNSMVRVGLLERDPEGRALALETIRKCYRAGLNLMVGSETAMGEHAGLQYDPSKPSMMNRLYALLAVDTAVLFPLSEQFTWKHVAERYLTRYHVCDVDVSIQCEQTNAVEILPIKQGEFVCIFKACTACVGWFSDPDRERFRKRDFFDDLWDRDY